MASLNKAIVMGHLGRDPEIRHTQDGRPIVNLSIATTENWRDKNTGERKEKTEWHRVVIFNDGLAKVAEQYLKKGSMVYIEGQLQTRKWTDKDGAEKYSTEIILQNFRGEMILMGGKEDKPTERHEESPKASTRQSSAPKPPQAELDDEIPF